MLLFLMAASTGSMNAVSAPAIASSNAIEQQTETCKGVVKDAMGDTVIGASVVVKGTTNGTITGIDGDFTLSGVSEGSILVISYVGYVTQEVKFNGQPLNVILKEDSQTLEEVVVVGYGVQKKANLTGAVATVNAKALESRPVSSVSAAIAGQMPGVTAIQSSGAPGGQAADITIRGKNSINAASPLVIVDGVPGSMNTIDPNDIETFTVLKDAASAAIYGSRGSNGVVLVSTKQGKSGKAKVAFNASFGVQTLEKKMDVLNATEWMEFKLRRNDANYLQEAKKLGLTSASIKDDNATRLSNLGIQAGTANSYLVVFDERWFNYLGDDMRNAHTYTPNPEQLSLLDWQDEFFRNSIVQDYSLNVSGGTENTSYLFSGGYMNQAGIVTGTGYERFSFRANIESKINKYLTIGMNMAPTYIVQDGSGQANGKDSQVHQALYATPVSEPGVGYMTNVDPNPYYLWAGSTSSPVYNMEKNIKQNRMMRLVGNHRFISICR